MRQVRGTTTLNARVAWLVMAVAVTCAGAALRAVTRLERDRIELEFRETSSTVARRLTSSPDASRRLLRCTVIDVRDRRQSGLRQLMMARELDHRLIKDVLSHELGGRGTLEYGAGGRCRMSIPSERWSVAGAKA